MVSLIEAQNVVAELRPDFISYVCTDFMLTEWANQGVISRIEIRDDVALYPKIIVIEILTAVSLKTKYNYRIKEIAETRKYLNLGIEDIDWSDENNILNFINLERVYNDKRAAIKKAIERINSIEKIKKLIDELYQENKKLEIMANYCFEFFEAKKEIQKNKPSFIN